MEAARQGAGGCQRQARRAAVAASAEVQPVPLRRGAAVLVSGRCLLHGPARALCMPALQPPRAKAGALLRPCCRGAPSGQASGAPRRPRLTWTVRPPKAVSQATPGCCSGRHTCKPCRCSPSSRTRSSSAGHCWPPTASTLRQEPWPAAAAGWGGVGGQSAAQQRSSAAAQRHAARQPAGISRAGGSRGQPPQNRLEPFQNHQLRAARPHPRAPGGWGHPARGRAAHSAPHR